MIAAAPALAQLFLSLAAIAGLMTLAQVLRGQDAFDPINRRFLFGVRVTMILFAGRALEAATGGGFRFMVLIAAALVPLAVLILCEGLLRRHAPGPIKAIVAGGAALFTFLAFVPTGLSEAARGYALLSYQLIGFSCVGWLILTRDQTSLNAAENQTVVRLGLSLILLIPMLVADHGAIALGLPVQLSSVGVLVLCWLAIGLGRGQGGHIGVLVSFAVMAGLAVLTGVLIGLIAGLGSEGTVVCVVLIAATVFLVAVLADARALRTQAYSQSLLAHLATGPADDAVSFLRGLQQHPFVDGAVVIREDLLSGLDPAALDRIFAAAPVLRKSDPPQLDRTCADHVTHLFERFAATHLFAVRRDPRLLVALAMPTLQTAPLAELELQVVQRMAALIARTEDATRKGTLP